MTDYQRAKRLWFWRGSLPVLLAFTVLFVCWSIVAHIAP